MSGTRLTRRNAERGLVALGYESAEIAANHFEPTRLLTASYLKRKIDSLAGLGNSPSFESSGSKVYAQSVYNKAALFRWLEVLGQLNLPYEAVATKRIPPTNVEVTPLMSEQLLSAYLNTMRTFRESISGVGLTRRQRAVRFAQMDSLPPKAMQDLVLGGWRFSTAPFSLRDLSLLARELPLVRIVGECRPYHEVFSVLGVPLKAHNRQAAIARIFTPTFEPPQPHSPSRR